ncbi:MAG TPA: glycosyltransferase 87 family protein, partial [Gaiellaceae bacterium]|nr:glycosyltransferase 87 family protein [Gaiellaceae bacterium]
MSALTGDRPALRDAASGVTLTRLAPVAVAAMALAALVQRASFGDYEQDAGPALRALIHGHVGRALGEQPLMGSFAVLARAPFALLASLAGAGETGIYRAGTAACALALAALSVHLARRSDRRAWAPALPLIVLLNPASLSAVQSGHPEELLAAALLVAALLAVDRSIVVSGLLLGLAVATKQWAVLGIGPALWLVPAGRRMLAAATAAGTAFLLTLPLLLGSASAFSATSHQAATAPTTTGRATVWFLFARHTTFHVHVPAGMRSTVSIATVPEWVARGSHPAIVILPLLVTLLLWRHKPTLTDAL